MGERTEKCVIQRHRLHALHVQVVEQVWVKVEEDGHVDRLAGVEALLFEAKTLDLAKVWRALRGRDAVCGDSDDVLVAAVLGLVEGEGRLAGEDAHLALLRDKLPRQLIRDGGVECDADSVRGGYGHEAARDFALVGAAVGADRLAAPAGGLADLRAKLATEVLQLSQSRGTCHLVQGNRAVRQRHRAEDQAHRVVPRDVGISRARP